jgi:hypothetical protein
LVYDKEMANGDQIQDHNRGELRCHPEASRGGILSGHREIGARYGSGKTSGISRAVVSRLALNRWATARLIMQRRSLCRNYSVRCAIRC